MTELQKYIAKNTDLEILPDNSQYTNRFEIKSESSNRIYIVAQRISDGEITCSCPGWIRSRNGVRSCKHVNTIKPLLRSAEEAIKKQLN